MNIFFTITPVSQPLLCKYTLTSSPTYPESSPLSSSLEKNCPKQHTGFIPCITLAPGKAVRWIPRSPQKNHKTEDHLQVTLPWTGALSLPSIPAKFGQSVTQRLHRIVAVRAIQGATGAMHCKNRVRSSIHFTAGTRRGGTQVLTVRHRNASTPSGPNAPPGQTRMQRPHPVQAGASVLPVELTARHDSWTRRPVTTPLSNSRGPNRGERRTVFLPGDPSPPAAATCFNRTIPCTFPSAILTGRYSGTGRAGMRSSFRRPASWMAVLSSASAIRSMPLVFSFGGIRYTGTGTSFPKTITDWAAGKNCTTEDLSSSERLSRQTSEKTSIP